MINCRIRILWFIRFRVSVALKSCLEKLLAVYDNPFSPVRRMFAIYNLTNKRMPGIRKSSHITGLFLLLFAPVSLALPIEELYKAEVLVVSEDERQFISGVRAGLLQVLVRVSGTQEIEDSAVIARSIRNPNAYYDAFEYASTDRTFQIEGKVVPAKLLRIFFDPGAVAKLLRRAGFSVWGSNRPGVLLWLAVSDENGRRIISDNSVSDNVAPGSNIPEDSISEIVRGLQDQARLRGVPLLFPLLDLEDSASLSTVEVWGAFLGKIDDASRRYNPDSVLTARIAHDNVGRWSANWSYRIDRDWKVARNASFSPQELVRAMIDRLADDLAARYAIDSSRGQVTLVIEAVESLGDYAAVGRYLDSLASVLNSFVIRVQDDEVEFALNTEGQNEQLIEIINLDKKMLLLSADERNNILRYRWLN